jgi:hypothetical protein
MFRVAISFLLAILLGCTPREADDEPAASSRRVAPGNASPAVADCTPYSPVAVELRGTLVASERFGPPNFGETPEQDEKIRVPFLLVAPAVEMCADEESVPGTATALVVDSVQLNFTRVHDEPMRLLGQPITVQGALSRAENGYHFGKVYMMVDSVIH